MTYVVICVDIKYQLCSFIVEMASRPKVGYGEPKILQILSHLNYKVATYNLTASYASSFCYYYDLYDYYRNRTVIYILQLERNLFFCILFISISKVVL
jgi:hypothetical protein